MAEEQLSNGHPDTSSIDFETAYLFMIGEQPHPQPQQQPASNSNSPRPPTTPRPTTPNLNLNFNFSQLSTVFSPAGSAGNGTVNDQTLSTPQKYHFESNAADFDAIGRLLLTPSVGPPQMLSPTMQLLLETPEALAGEGSKDQTNVIGSGSGNGHFPDVENGVYAMQSPTLSQIIMSGATTSPKMPYNLLPAMGMGFTPPAAAPSPPVSLAPLNSTSSLPHAEISPSVYTNLNLKYNFSSNSHHAYSNPYLASMPGPPFPIPTNAPAPQPTGFSPRQFQSPNWDLFGKGGIDLLSNTESSAIELFLDSIANEDTKDERNQVPTVKTENKEQPFTQEEQPPQEDHQKTKTRKHAAGRKALSTAEKKRLHLESEQKRRAQVKSSYDKLCSVMQSSDIDFEELLSKAQEHSSEPARKKRKKKKLKPKKISKFEMLSRAIMEINILTRVNAELRNSLK